MLTSKVTEQLHSRMKTWGTSMVKNWMVEKLLELWGMWKQENMGGWGFNEDLRSVQKPRRHITNDSGLAVKLDVTWLLLNSFGHRWSASKRLGRLLARQGFTRRCVLKSFRLRWIVTTPPLLPIQALEVGNACLLDWGGYSNARQDLEMFRPSCKAHALTRASFIEVALAGRRGGAQQDQASNESLL